MSDLARLFHDTYERLAPEYGYVTRDETRIFDKDSANGKLMCAVVEIVRREIESNQAARIEELEEESRDLSQIAGLALGEKRVLEGRIKELEAQVERLRGTAHYAASRWYDSASYSKFAPTIFKDYDRTINAINETPSQSLAAIERAAAEKMRERCAKVCEDVGAKAYNPRTHETSTCDCARSIRALEVDDD